MAGATDTKHTPDDRPESKHLEALIRQIFQPFRPSEGRIVADKSLRVTEPVGGAFEGGSKRLEAEREKLKFGPNRNDTGRAKQL